MNIPEIKAYMKKNHITYEKLSNDSGIPLTTIKYIFSGKTQNPRLDTLNPIKKALNLEEKEKPSGFPEDIADFARDMERIGITDEKLRLMTPEQKQAFYDTIKTLAENFVQNKK